MHVVLSHCQVRLWPSLTFINKNMTKIFIQTRDYQFIHPKFFFFRPGTPKTSFKTYSNEELNFFKFVSIVLNEFPEALRQIFVDKWNKRFASLHGSQVWDDSTGVRILLFNSKDPKCKIPIYEPFKDWDCTALFQAILHAQTFALPDPVTSNTKKTLYELFMRNRVPVPAGSFNSSVASPSGDKNETTALAIDQLRLLRNTICLVDKVKFDDYVKYAKEAFTAVNLSTKSLETIGNLVPLPNRKNQGTERKTSK